MLGPAEFRDRVKIYATDVDEEALSHARQGSYSEREIRGIPSELLDRYFDLVGGRYVFRKDLRRSVIFGRNDLVQDAPISRIDLLVCRNTLMYFNAETQARILTPVPLRAGRCRGALPRQGRDAAQPRRAVPADRPEAPDLPQGPAGQPAQRLQYADVQPLADRPELTGLEVLRSEAMLAAPLAQVVVTADGSGRAWSTGRRR